MTGTRFTADHLWVRPAGSAVVVGMTGFACGALGTVALVRLPQPGRRVQAGEACAEVESMKAASDVPAPVAGTVLDANPAVIADPALISRDPEGAGWLYRMAPDDPADTGALMDAAAYAAFVGAL